ncbi:MAG: HEPN domain-containing protein [Defluviitaleaceae bacterium]|nr:HEPN domain-containing protein [Defluviitaleaceae bacterium]
MLDEATKELSNYRLNQARDCLRVSELAIKEGLFKDSLNRSYYCIFHSMRAVLALDNFDSKKHSGIIDTFRKSYIKTEKFDIHFSAIIGNAFKMRNESDYQDFYFVVKEETIKQSENAKEFLNAVEAFLK